MADLKFVMDFLKELNIHNDVEWMHAHHAEYEKARDIFYAICVETLGRLADIEPEMKGLDPKQCIFRMARDTRFSLDKRPYKGHFAAYFVAGGKKTVKAGYYLHLQPGNESMVCVGLHCAPTAALKIIRQAIFENGETLEQRMQAPDFIQCYPVLDEGDKLKVLPKAMSSSPYSELIKMRNFDWYQTFDDERVLQSDFVDYVMHCFEKGKPVNDFFNTALANVSIKSIF